MFACTSYETKWIKDTSVLYGRCYVYVVQTKGITAKVYTWALRTHHRFNTVVPEKKSNRPEHRRPCRFCIMDSDIYFVCDMQMSCKRDLNLKTRSCLAITNATDQRTYSKSQLKKNCHRYFHDTKNLEYRIAAYVLWPFYEISPKLSSPYFFLTT